MRLAHREIERGVGIEGIRITEKLIRGETMGFLTLLHIFLFLDLKV